MCRKTEESRLPKPRPALWYQGGYGPFVLPYPPRPAPKLLSKYRLYRYPLFVCLN